MLSDELDSKPELLVQFVQNASIPLVQGLEDLESKHSCLPLLAPAVSSLCSPLEFTGHQPITALLLSLTADGGLSHVPERSPSLSEFGGVSVRSPLVIQTHSHQRASPSPPPILHDLQQSDSTSYVLLNLAKASSESLIFAADGAGDDDDEVVSSGDYGIDGSAPWYLRVQELAHDSLIAATRAQIARDARACQDARAASVSNGDHTHGSPADGDKRELPTRTSRPLSKQVLRCSFEGCCRTFTWPAHLKYHLKTHRNDRMFRCGAEGCGKSFYVLQRLQVHMRTHNGEKPFTCKEKNCGKKFTTAGNLKNHRRIHTGEKPFLCEADGCGRSFAEFSSLRKHMLVHSGEKPHHCGICGKTFSQSGSRNVHMRKRHGEEGLGSESRETGEALTHSSLLEADGENGDTMVTMTTAVEPMNLHHAMLRSPGSADSVVVLSQPHELVTMTTEGHAYGEDVVALL
ncbi:zinc finger protein 410 isoform X2 [Trematomus bernacchii]|uniref:zinc finger protein 410 isoform X2 n=1 Tax=Trematomus bernacchii TaxID=40690 RepID=UPI00146A0193|nr:zinc finger protein 410 isoform X2 [Trematomus bernacchii]